MDVAGNILNIQKGCVSTSAVTVQPIIAPAPVPKPQPIVQPLPPSPPTVISHVSTPISCNDSSSCTGTSCYVYNAGCQDTTVCKHGTDRKIIRSCQLFRYCYHRQGSQVVQSKNPYCKTGETFDALAMKCIPNIIGK